jgi:FKBP-type peptidyl-prolyl cis-trans isomerase SlyD
MQIAKHSVVTIDYTLTSPDGKVLDTSSGKQPLTYLHGVGGIIPGLEAALEGKTAGDSVNAVISPEQAYGNKDPQMVQAVPRAAFKGVADIQPGMQFQAQSPQGPRVVTVVSANDNEVTVDANHPLAGMQLTFDVTVKDVRAATADEISHGHVHGPGGHHHH